MKLTVIIVAYNSEDFIEDCVKSVIKYLPQNSEIIVVDNNSSDGTVKKLETFLPGISLIKSDQNLGFAKANNFASKKAQGEYLFFLNPDTEILEPIFEVLLNFYEKNGGVGLVAPKLIQPNGKIQESVKNLPTIWGAIKEFILQIPHAYSQFAPKENDPIEVESVYGAAMLIKKYLFEQVGGFDEKYFLYYEDVDFCKRIRQLNKKIYYYPKVKIKHLVGATKSIQDKYQLNLESANLYHGRLTVLVLHLIFKINSLIKRIL